MSHHHWPANCPTTGKFSGLGFVGKAGDPRAMVYLMAALKADETDKQENSVSDVIKELIARLSSTLKNEEEEPEFNAQAQDEKNLELSAAHEGSYEWLGRSLQEHLNSRRKADESSPYHFVLATYPNYAIYQEGADYFRIDYNRSGAKVNFGEPQEVDPVYQPTAKASAEASGDEPADNDTGNLIQGEQEAMSTATPEELLAAKEQENAELKATLDAVSNTLNEMKAAQDKKEADEKAKALADTRLAELEKITPVKDEVKAGLLDSLKVIGEPAYEAVKSAFAATAELRAGIAPTDGIKNPDEPGVKKNEQDVPKDTLDSLAAEAQAQFGKGQKSEDKE